jgi:hypothetical protein
MAEIYRNLMDPYLLVLNSVRIILKGMDSDLIKSKLWRTSRKAAKIK